MGHRVTGYNPEYIQKHPNCSWVRERPWADLSNIHPGVNPVDSTWIKIPQGETPVTGNVALKLGNLALFTISGNHHDND